MITIFSVPKPFTENTETRQLNAVRSWVRLKPACEVILCGDDEGVGEAALALGVRHVPDVSCNEYGTPLLNSAFEKVAVLARYPLLCYVNADIILFDDLLEATRRIRFDEFLMLGARQDLDLNQRVNFDDPTWSQKLRLLAVENGCEATHFYHDYFVFTPNQVLEKLPPFAVGRPRWDNWFVYHARKLDIPVVDASNVVTAIHQNHDYSHIPKHDYHSNVISEVQWEGPEARINRKLSAESIGAVHQFTMLDATHVLTPNLLLPALKFKYLKKRWHSLSILHPKTRPLIVAGALILRPIRWLNKRFQGL